MKIGYGKPFQIATERITPDVTPEVTPDVTPEVTPPVSEQVTVQAAEQVLALLRDLVAQNSRNTILVTSRKWSPSKWATGEVRGEVAGEVRGEVIALQEVMRVGHEKHKHSQKKNRYA
jgi:hypothetical protein